MMIKKISIRVLMLFLVAGGFFSTLNAQECTYRVFTDEFDYDGSPAASNWNFETGAGGWGNNELQNYTSSRENSYVSNGTLKIHAKKSPTGVWTSARMVTAGKATWKYGRFEIKAKLPTGKGTWPAIWMMPQNSTYGGWPNSGEIDIMEHVGYDLGTVHGTIHTEAYNHKIGTQRGGSVYVGDAHTEFHVYSIEWTPDKITWYVDDEEYYSFRNLNLTYKEWPFDKPFFIIMNIAIGGDWGGAQGIDENLTEAVMEVDYVRVFQSSLPDFEVSGPENLNMNVEADFWVPQIEGVDYSWNLPSDAEILTEPNSHRIKVKWGSTNGTVECTIISECEEKEGTPLMVNMQVKPQSFPFVLPSLNQHGNPNWVVPEQESGNSFSLSVDGQHTKVDFSIDEPLENPYISYPLSFVGDFSEVTSVVLPVKTYTDRAPDVLRVDFIDENGKVNTSDLFKINDVEAYSHLHWYGYDFAGSTSIWKMDRIVEIRVYVNYGYFGNPGSGTFILGDIELAPEGFFAESIMPGESPWILSLSTGWNVPAPFQQMATLAASDGEVNIKTVSVEMPDSNFVEYIFEQPVDLHFNSEMVIDFKLDGDFPGQLKVALVDEKGNYNPNDVFLIDDFSSVATDSEFSYTFGNKGNAGSFMLSRVTSLRVWINEPGGDSGASDFSISDIWFNEAQSGVGVSTFNKFENVKVYPNPANNYFFIETPGWQNASWQLLNTSGIAVKRGELTGNNEEIDIRSLSSGMFYLYIEKNNQFMDYQKLIIK
jgi:beta-glucanase (GH16 family)